MVAKSDLGKALERAMNKAEIMVCEKDSKYWYYTGNDDVLIHHYRNEAPVEYRGPDMDDWQFVLPWKCDMEDGSARTPENDHYRVSNKQYHFRINKNYDTIEMRGLFVALSEDGFLDINYDFNAKPNVGFKFKGGNLFEVEKL